MAGSQPLRTKCGFVAALTVTILTFADRARAQDPPLPPLPAPPVQGLSNYIESEDLQAGMTAPPTAPQPSYYPGMIPSGTRVELGLFDTITESIFGQPDPDTWRPLPLSTLFSEGWNEAWVPSPNGSGGAPRQGWINAQDGNLYRLSFFTFAQGFNNGPRGNAYLGAYTIFTPLSRRLDLITNIPFVLRNNAVTGLPVIDPNRTGGRRRRATRGSATSRSRPASCCTRRRTSPSRASSRS